MVFCNWDIFDLYWIFFAVAYLGIDLWTATAWHWTWCRGLKTWEPSVSLSSPTTRSSPRASEYHQLHFTSSHHPIIDYFSNNSKTRSVLFLILPYWSFRCVISLLVLSCSQYHLYHIRQHKTVVRVLHESGFWKLLHTAHTEHLYLRTWRKSTAVTTLHDAAVVEKKSWKESKQKFTQVWHFPH